MTRKKILFVTQRDFYPFFVGGAEISAHTLLSYLTSRGHQCLALGILGRNLEDAGEYIKRFEEQSIFCELISETIKLRDYKIPKELYLFLNAGYDIKLTLLNNFAKFFQEQASKDKPDLVITQMMGSGLAVRFCWDNKIPCAHLIRDVNTLYNLEPLFLEPKYLGYPNLFSNSKYVQGEFKRKYKQDSTILYPSIKIEDYELGNHKGEYITFINPTDKKGVELFMGIVKMLPQFEFLVVEGWDKIDQSSPLRKLENVIIKNRQFDMRNVYSETKLLIVPSIWQEAFARVVIEAQTSGIPVIAGRHSGLIESVGRGGILIKDYTDPNSWAKVIANLCDNHKLYRTLSKKAKENSRKFDISKTAKEFCEIYDL